MNTDTVQSKKLESPQNGRTKEDTLLQNQLEQLEQKANDLEIDKSRYCQVLDHAVDGIVVHTLDHEVVLYNSTMEKMLGYKKCDVLGEPVTKIFPSQYLAAVKSFKETGRQEAAGTMSGTINEMEVTRKDGSKFWANFTFSSFEEGGEAQLATFIKDITVEKLSRDTIDGQLEAVNAVWVQFDPQGNLQTANGLFLKAFNYKEEDILNKPDKLFVRIEDLPAHDKLWAQLREGVLQRGEFRRLTSDGKEVWLQGSYKPVKDGSGKISRVEFFASIITDVKLRDIDYGGQLEAINKSNAVVEFDMNGNLLRANENFLETMGYTLDEVKGRHHRVFCDSTYANSPDYKDFWARLNKGEFFTGEFERFDKKGESVWLQAAYNPIFDLDGKPFKVVKFAADISSQKQSMKEINRVVTTVIEQGNLSERVSYGDAQGMELELLQSINMLLEGIGVPLLQVSDVMEEMARGNLTSSVTVECKGDIKKMADNLTVAMDNLNDLLSDIDKNSNLIASSSDQMLVKSDQMQGTTAQVASAIGQMAEGVHDQASQIDESYRLIEVVRNSADNVGNQAEKINQAAMKGQENAKKGLGTVKKVVESMTQIEGSADITSKSIDVLTQRSEEIAKTLTVITDIAWQTNLLALNAAIEAARAGDAGRGFAVVAEEIRKLAEDSRTSAGDIENVIKGVEKDIMKAASAIETMAASVKSGNDATKEAETVFKEIDSSVIETFDFSQKVLTATDVQKTSIAETVKNIEKIVVVAEETSSGTEEIATSAKDLSNGMIEFNSSSKGLADIATDLRIGVSKFKLKNAN